MTRQEIALVTGSSTGIGFETSIALARNGFHTYASMRNIGNGRSNHIVNVARKENLPLQVIHLDVDNDKSVLDAINRIKREKGRIDIVINNAGYALVGPFEETSMEEIKAQFETNLFGTIRIMQAVIPIMREQRRGTIVNITSLGGRVALPLDSIYHGTKFALEGISESVKYEVDPFGIKIILVEPGAVGSNFWKNLKLAKTSSSDSDNSHYIQLTNNMSESFKQMEQNTIHPSEVASVILLAVMTDDPAFRYQVGKDAVMLLETRRNLSDRDFENFIKKQFNL
ncbi:MAG: SDR family oxidoreductase [Nitrososphaeraceae archaeon]|nr:SDR family oxidoreductase [Nitrososphaeraceae archaeon]